MARAGRAADLSRDKSREQIFPIACSPVEAPVFGEPTHGLLLQFALYHGRALSLNNIRARVDLDAACAAVDAPMDELAQGGACPFLGMPARLVPVLPAWPRYPKSVETGCFAVEGGA